MGRISQTHINSMGTRRFLLSLVTQKVHTMVVVGAEKISSRPVLT